MKPPLVVFLYLAVVLTQVSLLFPQNLGRFRKVSGWPLTMYQTEFRFEGDIQPNGQLLHSLVPKADQLMWGRVFLNIVLWLAILHGTWVVYHKFSPAKIHGRRTRTRHSLK